MKVVSIILLISFFAVGVRFIEVTRRSDLSYTQKGRRVKWVIAGLLALSVLLILIN
ncbi:MAG: hypothetical protein PUF10_02740 [Bacteroidales bacterium]|nr:hypothetical protein [Bacteroidales bacterium]